MKRRQFFKQTALIGASGLISLGAHSWAYRAQAQSSGSDENAPRLIVIFLRGAADGLNIVVPYQEPHYYEARPVIAITPPNSPEGAIDLDGQFGLHPALEPLMSEWQSGNLAFVHACGSVDATRSHFQAQDYMETGTPGESTADGWLNRLLALLPGDNPTQAVSVGARMPLIFTGNEAVASLADNGQADRPLPVDRPQIQTAFDQLYAGNSNLASAYQEGREAREIVLREVSEEMMEASRGAQTPASFVSSARDLARLMSGDAATRVAFMELGGWDTHVNEPDILQRNLASLADGLKGLVQGLGKAYDHTSIVVMSEFGRRVAENGNGGTDHGHGNVLWLLGGGIQGQKVYGQWPGLAPAEQHESRDLAITTDFRDVLISLLKQQFDLDSADLARVFPNYQAQTTFHLLA
jgi:uncharacterized protein (DUF1501 family)